MALQNVNNLFHNIAKTATRKNQPTYQAPKQQSVSNTGGGGYQHGGWYMSPNGRVQQFWNGQWFDSAQSDGGNSGGGFEEPQYDWDALYRPQFEALDSAENTARENANLLEQDITTEREGQLRRVGLEEQLANEKFAQSEKKAGQNQESALAQAVRDYLALNQMGHVRFGGGSSAGRAMGELAQREYFRNQGEVQKSYANIFGEIDSSKRAAYLTFVNTREEIEDWTRTEVNKVKREMNNALESIKLARAQTEADKSAKRMQVLDRAVEQARAIKLQKQQNMEALNIWKQQQDYLIANKLVPIYKDYNPNLSGYNPQQTQVGASNSNIQGGGNSQLLNIRWNPSTKNFESEEENSPFGSYA